MTSELNAAPEPALPRWLRALASGIGFSVFGIGSLVLVGLCFPVVRLVTRDPAIRTRRARRLIGASFRLFLRTLVALGAIRLRFEHGERLETPGPLLILANHPTLIDVCLLVSCVPEADCVVKREAWSNPFLAGVVRAADYIPNDGGEGLIRTCVERLRTGRTLVLFPEGTRSPRGGLRSFKRGAARIALQSGCPVLLVDVVCRPAFLGKGDPWYQVPGTLPCYTVTAHAPIPVGLAPGVSEAAEARRLTGEWRRGYEERLGHA